MESLNKLTNWVKNYIAEQTKESDISERAMDFLNQLNKSECAECVDKYVKNDELSTVYLRDELLNKFTDFDSRNLVDSNAFYTIDSANSYKLEDGETFKSREEAATKRRKEVLESLGNEPYKYDDSARKELDAGMTELWDKHGSFFAFGDDQFNEAKKEGVTYVSMPVGGLYCPKDNADALWNELNELHASFKKKHLELNGKRNIIIYELHNHEAFYTGYIESTCDAVEDFDITAEEVYAVYCDVAPTVDVW